VLQRREGRRAPRGIALLQCFEDTSFHLHANTFEPSMCAGVVRLQGEHRTVVFDSVVAAWVDQTIRRERHFAAREKVRDLFVRRERADCARWRRDCYRFFATLPPERTASREAEQHHETYDDRWSLGARDDVLAGDEIDRHGVAQFVVAPRCSRQEQVGARRRDRLVQESIDALIADEHRDRMLFLAPSRRHEDQLGELRVQPIEQRSRIATQGTEICNQDAAAAADQQVDGGIGGRSVPDRVLGTR